VKIVRLTLLFLGMCTLIAWGTVARAIATEVDSPFDPAGYFYNPIGWTPVAEGFQTGGKDAGDCVLRSAPICRRVAVEADVTAERAENDQWKVVGVAIFHDRHNYWHFGMVQPPDGSGRANFCELSQMRNSTWNSQHNLKLEFHELHGEPWKIAQPYRLRIELDPAGIEGSLRDDQGKLLERKRYAFSKPAVTTGRPGLRSPGFAARLRHICATYSDPVTEPGGASPTFPPVRVSRLCAVPSQDAGDVSLRGGLD